MKLTLSPVTACLRAPFAAGHGSLTERELLLVTLEAADGQRGHGEAAPLRSYDGVTIADVRAALEDCRSVLAGADGAPRAEVLSRCADAAVLPQARAAIDLALWDLEGRRAGAPVWRLLGTRAPAPVPVNWTIGSADRAGAAREATHARAAGFTTLKAKVALGDDAGRLAAIRAVAGAGLKIRIDANGTWSPAEARAHLRALEPVGIELCEEPVHGLEPIAELSAQTDIPLALDESAAHPGAFDRRACALACLKIAASGGITGLLHAAGRARDVGYEVYLASTLDGPLGIAAALHAAAALGPLRACGLATLGMFDSRPDPLRPASGAIEVPRGPGLGDGLLAWYGGY